MLSLKPFVELDRPIIPVQNRLLTVAGNRSLDFQVFSCLAIELILLFVEYISYCVTALSN